MVERLTLLSEELLSMIAGRRLLIWFNDVSTYGGAHAPAATRVCSVLAHAHSGHTDKLGGSKRRDTETVCKW